VVAYFLVYFHRVSTSVLAKDFMRDFGISAVAGPLAYLDVLIGWHGVFIALGIITLILAFLIWTVVRDSPVKVGLPSIAEIEAWEAGKSAPEKREVKKMGIASAVKAIFSRPRFWPLAIWFFMAYGTIMAFQGLWTAPYLVDVAKMDKVTAGGVVSMIAVGMVFGCPLAGYLADKIFKSRKKVLIIGTLIYTITWAVLWITAGQITSGLFYVLFFLMGFFCGWFVVSYAQIKTLFPIEIAGTVTSCLNFFPFFGGAVLQQVTSYIIASYGQVAPKVYTLARYRAAWLLCLICMIIGLVSVLFSTERGL
jgi:sugar phosphate permease